MCSEPGEASGRRRDLESRSERARLRIRQNGRELSLSPFPSRFLAAAILAMLGELRGFEPGAGVTIEIEPPGEPVRD